MSAPKTSACRQPEPVANPKASTTGAGVRAVVAVAAMTPGTASGVNVKGGTKRLTEARCPAIDGL